MNVARRCPVSDKGGDEMGSVSDKGDHKIGSVRPNYRVGATGCVGVTDWSCVGATGWSRVTAMGSENAKLPTPRMIPKETLAVLNRKSCPSASPPNGSGNQSRLLRCHFVLAASAPMASHFALAVGAPMASRFALAVVAPMASHFALAAADPMTGQLGTLGRVASAPAPTGSHWQSLKTPESAAYSPRLPVGSSASVT